ncbi:MAG: ribonuclease HI [Desulfurivibrionaceae bacterium]|nr:ribonuclease HI [Desulfobulbales bacterium]MDT8334934.1 ribonuclease HI [Desulfurivibrionaceae bacterium]
MAAKKKFYAIAVGAKPGIYDNWPEANAQVRGFPGARYKGFPTRREAEGWLEKPQDGRKAGAGSKPAKKPGSTAADPAPKPGEVSIYTDGGARFNPGPGGYGIVQICNGETTERCGGYRHTTNNRMELMGCIVALRELEYRDKPVTVYCDSQYVVNGINKGWARAWRKRGWLKSTGEPAFNPDLWGELLDLIEGLDVTFKWVRGHAGHPQNERCDELVAACWAKKNLPVDTGYKNPDS